MKKTLLMIFLILSLLVSCATKTVKPGVQETPADDSLIETTVDVSESPVVEEITAVEDVVVVEEIPEEVVEDELPAESVEIVEVSSESQVASEPEFDWSAFIASDPSIWEAPITAKAEEPEVGEAFEAETAAVEEPVVTESSAVVEEPSAPVETPAVETPAPLETPKAVESSSATVVEAEKESLSAKQIIENVGKFIQREKLFSFGVLTIIIGFFYLIIVLIKTSEAHLERKEARNSRRSSRNEESESTYENESESASSDKSDTSLSDEDDEFLKTLLGGND
ncbi:MAG: hypothetical protein MJ057_07370 [Sphaerochaetaceae bacterium]|nr:hypothetical protein [Sphaerochaetaceae bacterium]